MEKRTAGILLYRRKAKVLEVLLVHPGGPFWAHKDDGAWSIPKGLYGAEEEPLAAATREFAEETGGTFAGTPHPLGTFRQPSGKVLSAWSVEGDFDPKKLVSSTCMVEWPPHSGKQMEIPEVDRGAWLTVDKATVKIHLGQKSVLRALLAHLGESGS